MKSTKILFFFFFSIIYIQLSAQIEPEKSSDDWEVWYDKVPVSGEIRVGVMEDFIPDDLQPTSFYVSIPENELNLLCVEICSKDGRYQASRHYRLDKLQVGVNQLLWPTELSKELRHYNKQELSILCRIGKTCDQDPEYFVLASWSDNFASDTFTLLLNSEVPPDINITDKNNNSNYDIKCEKLDLNQMVTYNCKCDIPKSVLTVDSDVKIVKRVRRINRVSYKRYPFPIKLFK